jgi:tetratricopeptide (TPR) repeat protein
MEDSAMRSYARLTIVGLLLATAGPAAQELGTITFPTSGKPAAQPAFLEGVKALHSFQFDEAAEAFKRAGKADPDFALAYWGEAMSHNHPLWAQQDIKAATQALEKLAPTHEARLAKAKLPKEKAFLEAQQVLYFAPGDKLARDKAYSEAMAAMHAQWPDDHEVAIFYALSLLGTVRPGDTGFRRQALAASIAQKVFAENPKHPGSAHFIIHAFDDPEHAPLALGAANAYAAIAPAAAHALHMPSHIYVQLGMWQETAASNVDAYKAAVDLNTRMKLAEGREDFHTLSWLGYAHLMLGRFDEAKKDVDRAKDAADRNAGNRAVQNGYLGMRARYILETGQWEKIALDAPAAAPAGGDAHANMPGMPGMAYADPGNAWIFVAGMSAAKMGDAKTAEAAEMRLRAAREKAAATSAYAGREVSILEKEIGAVARWAAGRKDEALGLAKEAADIERTTNAPSGPPDPMKPAAELYGELLLESNRAEEAAAAFAQALLRTPKRTPSLLGLARASAKAGNTAAARQHYSTLAGMPGAAPTSPAVVEAQKFLKTAVTETGARRR